MLDSAVMITESEVKKFRKFLKNRLYSLRFLNRPKFRNQNRQIILMILTLLQFKSVHQLKIHQALKI